ncbi:hypothetical protein KAU11_09535 [Candidatus Babeliales bacterium]|nr:hypothetical protein [Candidatus Babeliales bacterium]
MLTDEEKRTSRKEANHRYYMKNHTKWNVFYPSSVASQLGTGNLAGHKLDDEEDELAAIEREFRRLGLKSVRTKVYVRGVINE